MGIDVMERTDAVVDEEERVFVTLTVDDQLCGVPVLGVRDILGDAFTRIPLAPPEIAGSLNLRGRIVTAIDLRRRLRLPPAPADRHACPWSPRGRCTLRPAGRSGIRGHEPEGQCVRAQSANLAAGLG